MKKLFPLLLFLLITASAFAAKPIKLTGNLQNTNGAKKIYLYQYKGLDRNKIDSTSLTDGLFAFKLKNLPRGMYALGTSEKSVFEVILGKESFFVSADMEKLPGSVKTENSIENAIFKQFLDYNESVNTRMRTLEQKALGLAQLKNSDPEQYQQKLQQLQQTSDSIQQQQQEHYKTLAAQGKDLFITKVIDFYTISPDATKDNFISKEQLRDPELWRGSMVFQKINIMFQRFYNPADTEAQLQAALQLINLTSANSTEREMLYESLVNALVYRNQSAAAKVAKRYKKDFPKSEKAAKMLAALPVSPPGIGDVATNITLKTPEGKNMSLYNLRGKVVLLDFWASWCGPCRHENPNVVAAYQAYKDKGFTVFSVSLDTDRNKWIQAIEKDNMTWHHVSDLKGWQSAAGAAYGVKSIPATYLIDKNGVIIGQNLRGNALKEKLAEVFK